MNKTYYKSFMLTLAAVMTVSLPLPSSSAFAADDKIPALCNKADKSLVLIEYNWGNENTSREEFGQGVVLDKEGLILISGALIPEQLPAQYIKQIKVRLPGDHFSTVKATLLGRTTNRLFAYLKTEKPIPAESLDISDMQTPSVGTHVVSVFRQRKQADYAIAMAETSIRTVLPASQNLFLTNFPGVGRATSPVFNAETGKLAGIALQSAPESGGNGSGSDEQSTIFFGGSEIKNILMARPTAPFSSPRPYIGVTDISGIDEEMRSVLQLQNECGVTVGAVIPDHPADKAGLKTRDVILAINGQPFSESIVPEIMRVQFTTTIEKLPVNQDAMLTVLRDGNRMEIKIHVGQSPTESFQLPHVFNSRLGITTRDLTFSDIYLRKLPTDTKGVAVAMIKNGSPTALGTTPMRPGLLITRINQTDIANQADFESTMKAIPADAKEIIFRVIRPDGETQVCRVELSK